MAQPARTAQGLCLPAMALLPAPRSQKPATLRRFSLVLAGLLAATASCSSGETGLILGHPEPQSLAGSAGSGGVGGRAAGGTSAQAGAGAGAVGGTGLGAAGQGGAGAGRAGSEDGGAAGTSAGSGGGGADAPWIAERCTPVVSVDNRDTTSQGKLFDDAAPEPEMLVVQAAHAACRELYRAPDEVPTIADVTLVIEDYAGVAGTAGTELRISSSYLKQQSDAGVDLPLEIAGILRFTTSIVYQQTAGGAAPSWFVRGIADFVRLQAHLVDPGQPKRGDNYDSNSQVTALFFDYLRQSYPDIVYQLNQSVAVRGSAWDIDVFVDLTGSDLPTLWSEFQLTLPE